MAQSIRLVISSHLVDPYLSFHNQGDAQIARDVVLDSISAPPNAPLRLFILGIGDTVSSDVCERLATAGNGHYLLAVSAESILSKCTGLLRAGRTSTITDVSVDWTADIPPGHSTSVQPFIQQSPPESSFPEMYPSSRSVLFAIIHTRAVPKQVVVRGKVDGKDVFIRVDVESAKFGRQLSKPPFIHTLAANRLIRDLEDENAKGKLSEITQRREVVKLGEYYQLASSHTSFVAVDYGEVQPHDPTPRQEPSVLSTAVTSLVGSIWQYLADPTSLFKSATATDRPKHARNDGLPGGWGASDSADSEVPSDLDTEYSDSDEDYDEWASDDTFSTLSSLESYSSVDTRQAQRPRHSSSTHQHRVPSPQVPYAPPPAAPPTTGTAERFKPLPINPHVATLVQQMSTSGSFALTDALAAIVGRDVLEKARLWEDEELAATALAMVYLEKNLGDHLEVCQLLMEKGMEFVKNHPKAEKFDEMLDLARGIVQPDGM